MLIILIFTMSSCAFHAQYPAQWAPLESVKTDECTKISGEYVGITQDHDCLESASFYNCGDLASIFGLNKSFWDYRLKIKRISDEKVSIQSLSEDGLSHTKILDSNNNDFECTNKGLTIDVSPPTWDSERPGFTTGYPGAITIKASFKKAQDGSLIMEVEDSRFALAAFFIPMGFSATSWARWDVNDEEKAKKDREIKKHLKGLKQVCKESNMQDPNYMYRIGDFYWFGTSPYPKDLVRAYIWYNLAASQGHYWASRAVKRVADLLSEKELKEAKNILENWQPEKCEDDLKWIKSN